MGVHRARAVELLDIFFAIPSLLPQTRTLVISLSASTEVVGLALAYTVLMSLFWLLLLLMLFRPWAFAASGVGKMRIYSNCCFL